MTAPSLDAAIVRLRDPAQKPCGCTECPRHFTERVEREEHRHFIEHRDKEIREEVFDAEP